MQSYNLSGVLLEDYWNAKLDEFFRNCIDFYIMLESPRLYSAMITMYTHQLKCATKSSFQSNCYDMTVMENDVYALTRAVCLAALGEKGKLVLQHVHSLRL